MENITSRFSKFVNTQVTTSAQVQAPQKQTWYMLFVSLFGIYLLSSGISLAIFSFLKKEPGALISGLEGARSRINLNLPKTEECPINGQKFTKLERDIWEKRRPTFAIIENHVDSRPPSGVSKADVVYEAVAEGGITRFGTVFYCGASAQDVRIGPIRSVRVYYVNWASEYGESPLFVHSGGANSICNSCPGGVKPRGQVDPEVDALKLLAGIGWRSGTYGNALDAGTNIGFPVVWRDYERIPGAASEHTFMGSTDKLFEEGQKRSFGYKDTNGNPWNKNFVEWKFTDDKALSTPKAEDISFEFWSNKPDYNVTWKYNKATNSYLRNNGGKEHLDMDFKVQLSAKNVVIMFVSEDGPVDKEGHMFYTTVGSGSFLVFQNGDVSTGTWSKDSREGRTIFKVDGRELEFVRGTIWIEAVPVGNEIKY